MPEHRSAIDRIPLARLLSKPWCAACYEKEFKHAPKDWYFVGVEKCSSCGTFGSVAYALPLGTKVKRL